MKVFNQGGKSATEAYHDFLVEYAGCSANNESLMGYGVEGAIESSNPRGWCRDVILHVGPFGKKDQVTLDVSRTGYKMPARFNKLISDYLPLDWWERREPKRWNKGTTQRWAFQHKMGHTNGGCLQVFTAGREGRTLVASAFSRTAYIAPVGVIDFSLLNLMAQNLIQRYPTLFDNYELTWHLSQAQWRPWMSRPYLQSTGVYDRIREEHPGCWMSQMWDWMEEVRETPMVQDSSYAFFRNWVFNRHPSAFEYPSYHPADLHKYQVARFNAENGINPDPKWVPNRNQMKEIKEAEANWDGVDPENFLDDIPDTEAVDLGLSNGWCDECGLSVKEPLRELI